MRESMQDADRSSSRFDISTPVLVGLIIAVIVLVAGIVWYYMDTRAKEALEQDRRAYVEATEDILGSIAEAAVRVNVNQREWPDLSDAQIEALGAATVILMEAGERAESLNVPEGFSDHYELFHAGTQGYAEGATILDEAVAQDMDQDLRIEARDTFVEAASLLTQANDLMDLKRREYLIF
jgi:hypothetical protein